MSAGFAFVSPPPNTITALAAQSAEIEAEDVEVVAPAEASEPALGQGEDDFPAEVHAEDIVSDEGDAEAEGEEDVRGADSEEEDDAAPEMVEEEGTEPHEEEHERAEGAQATPADEEGDALKAADEPADEGAAAAVSEAEFEEAAGERGRSPARGLPATAAPAADLASAGIRAQSPAPAAGETSPRGRPRPDAQQASPVSEGRTGGRIRRRNPILWNPAGRGGAATSPQEAAQSTPTPGGGLVMGFSGC